MYTYSKSGNVVQMEMRNEGANASTPRTRYTYGYDNLNRLTRADYSPWNGSSYIATRAYDEQSLTYDKNGNIRTLTRYDRYASRDDSLQYNYQGGKNRLSIFYDAASSQSGAIPTSFNYDANGSVTSMHIYTNEEAERYLRYDHRRLPVWTQYLDYYDFSTTNTNYRYSDVGERYYKKVQGQAGTYYLLDGAVQVAVLSETGTFQHWNILSPSGEVLGRLEEDGSGLGARRYYAKDHLGSVRAVRTATGAIVEATDYYAFGLDLPGRRFVSGSATREHFTGKERDSETGFDYFGARYYMPEIGRWMSVDPLADSYPDWSPYNYVLNNPVSLTDPTGRCPENGSAGPNQYGPGMCLPGIVVEGRRPREPISMAVLTPLAIPAAAEPTPVGEAALALAALGILGYNAFIADDVSPGWQPGPNVVLPPPVIVPSETNPDLDRRIGDLIPGSLKRVRDYPSELEGFTLREILRKAQQGGSEGKKAQKLKKLYEQQKRLKDKTGGKR